MGELVLTTFEWVPPPPRGFVRDLRLRWALEEAGLPYRIEGASGTRDAVHLERQPFGQVPWLTDGDVRIFESGAMLLHVGERSEALLPAGAADRSQAVQWLFAALNSVEVASLPWSILAFAGDTTSPAARRMADFLSGRLKRLKPLLGRREWLAGGFSIADIAMADVLRLVDRLGGLADHPACAAYMARATARPAFVKAHADQIAYYEAADRRRAG